MSVMVEVYYRGPRDVDRDEDLRQQVESHGGRIDFQEEARDIDGSTSICLTFEFEDWKPAEAAASCLRRAGSHVEGPTAYGE